MGRDCEPEITLAVISGGSSESFRPFALKSCSRGKTHNEILVAVLNSVDFPAYALTRRANTQLAPMKLAIWRAQCLFTFTITKLVIHGFTCGFIYHSLMPISSFCVAACAWLARPFFEPKSMGVRIPLSVNFQRFCLGCACS